LPAQKILSIFIAEDSQAKRLAVSGQRSKPGTRGKLAFGRAGATDFVEFFDEAVAKWALPTQLLDERFGSFEILLRYFAIGEHLAKTPLDLVFG
jgi:hypothetical protein